MSVHELRPMGIGDILDTTFRLYRQRFLTFLLIALAVYIPYAILMGLSESSGPAFTAGAGPSAGPQLNPLGFSLQMIGVAFFSLILFPLCLAAMVHNISASYLGETLSAGDCYARAMPRVLPLLGTQVIVGIVVMIGFLLFIVPGVIFSLWYYVVVPVVILEGAAGFRALGRSRELVRGNLGKAFVLGLVVFLLSAIFGGVLQGVAKFVPWPHPALATFALSILPALWLPIQTAPSILLYYDLRIRKEAFDLQQLSETLNQPAAL
jgi:hypothetical protein